MSSAKLPECFVDRSLGRRTAALLREHGWVVHLIADHYPDDAEEVADEDWIGEGCRHGWVLLTKDQRIRYRSHELAALEAGHLFCLRDGNLGFAEMAKRFLAAEPAMRRAVDRERRGLWLVYEGGRIAQRWP